MLNHRNREGEFDLKKKKRKHRKEGSGERITTKEREKPENLQELRAEKEVTVAPRVSWWNENYPRGGTGNRGGEGEGNGPSPKHLGERGRNSSHKRESGDGKERGKRQTTGGGKRERSRGEERGFFSESVVQKKKGKARKKEQRLERRKGSSSSYGAEGPSGKNFGINARRDSLERTVPLSTEGGG